MARIKVMWTEPIFNDFVKEAMLNPEEITILKMMSQKYTIKEISEHIKLSTSTVSRRIDNISKKYSYLSQMYPDRFPIQK